MLDSKLISKMVAEIGIELDLTEDELDFTFIQFLTTGYRETQNMVHRLLIKVI